MSLLEALVFFPMAFLAVIGAAGMISSKNPVHSALYLILNFFALAVIFLILLAPLIAALQIIVYAGAIMVLFLFVILFFIQPGQKHLLAYSLPGQTLLSAIIVVILLAVVLYSLYRGGLFTAVAISEEAKIPPEEIYSSATFGKILFSRYLLPFELTSLLLLSAMLGAVVMARSRPAGDSGEERANSERGGGV